MDTLEVMFKRFICSRFGHSYPSAIRCSPEDVAKARATCERCGDFSDKRYAEAVVSMQELTPLARTGASLVIPLNVSDDHFTWWYDELRGEPGSEKMSEYEVAALAWHEAVDRIRDANA